MHVIKSTKINRNSLLVLGFIALTILFFRFFFPYSNPINFDVFGYYLYLPFTFIYHDLGLSNIAQLHQLMDTYDPSVSFYQASVGPSGNWIMKYSMGMAILYSPFFLLSHFFALLSNYPADGFSLPYQLGIIVGSTVYTLIGIFVLRKVLLKFFGDSVVVFTLLLLFFGTNYFDQSIFNAELAHNYLFTLYILVLWFTIRWHENHKRKHIILLAIFSGILVLARPTEIIVILIPFLWGVYNWKSFREKLLLLKQFKLQLLLFTLIFVLLGSLQLVYWKIFSGQFFYYSYSNAGEGFDFFAPHTIQTLFSFRKGWLIYTPVMIFAIGGFYFVLKEKRKVFFPLFLFFILNLYLVSSWSCWWYANCFSQRALVQSYAVMAIPLGFFVQRVLKSRLVFKYLFAALALFFVVLNLFQTWQMRNQILSGDRMTFAFYKQIFGKTEVSTEDHKLLLVDRWLEGDERLKDESGYKSRLLTAFDFEKGPQKFQKYLQNDFSHSGQSSFQFDNSILYFNLFEKDFETLTGYDHAWIRVVFYVFPQSELEQKDFTLVMQFMHKGKIYKYKGENILPLLKNKTLQIGKWNKLSFDYLTPEVRTKEDVLKIYFWNKGRGKVIIDDVTVTVFEPDRGE